MKKTIIRKLVYSSSFLAIAYLLPFVTGEIPKIGNMLCPMHLPVILCGFICGPLWGACVGICAPFLRSFTLGLPPLFPNAIAMALELAFYGAVSGILYRVLPKKIPFIYVSLISAMISGRIIWGAARYAFSFIGENKFSFSIFISGAVTTAIPGIIIQIILIPALVISLKKAKLIIE